MKGYYAFFSLYTCQGLFLRLLNCYCMLMLRFWHVSHVDILLWPLRFLLQFFGFVRNRNVRNLQSIDVMEEKLE